MFRPIQGVRNFDAALRDLRHESFEVRASAAQDLAHHVADRGERAVAELIGGLEDNHGAVRAAAALSLAESSSTDAVEALVGVIEDEVAEVRAAVLTALGEMGAEAAAKVVAQALDDEVAPVRFQAIIAYVRLGPDRDCVVQQLLRATEDEDALVAHIALRMAEELGGPDEHDGQDEQDSEPVDPRIVERAAELLGHESPIVAVAAAVILGRCGRNDGAQILVDVASGALKTDQSDDEAASLELCGELGLSQATASLERRAFGRRGLLGLRSDPLAWQARVALAALGHQRASDWIMRELGSWTRERRTLAVAAAGRARLTRAADAIAAMRGDPARADQDAVQEALLLLRPESP